MSSTFNNLNINTLTINNCPSATSTSKILGYDPVSGNVLAVTEASVWSGLATSDLNMNSYNIVAPGNGLGISADNAINLTSQAAMNLTGDSVNLTSVGNSISMNSPQSIGITAGDSLSITAAGSDDMTLTAAEGAMNLNAPLGPMTLTADNINLTSTSNSIDLNSGVAISLTANDGVYITAGSDPMTLTATNSNMTLSATNISLTTNDTGISISANDDVAISSAYSSISIHSGTNMSILTNDGALTVNAGADPLNLYGNDINIGSSTATINMTSSDSINLTCPIITIPSIPSATNNNVLYFDTTTHAISYGVGSLFPAITVQAANGTLTLTSAMNRSTYILTGTSAIQTIATSLSGVASGYCVYLRNGNNATGGTKDITISGAVSATLHTKTVTTNSSYILLFWNGTALTAYT